MASADFLVFFPQFFWCSNVSVRTNVERTVKSSPTAESTVGKFLLHHHSRFLHLPSVLHYLADFVLMKLLPGSRSYILRFFIACRFLILRKQILYENMCLNRNLNFHLKNKRHKQLIDRAKADDNVHLPFQQFLPITILIYTEAL